MRKSRINTEPYGFQSRSTVALELRESLIGNTRVNDVRLKHLLWNYIQQRSVSGSVIIIQSFCIHEKKNSPLLYNHSSAAQDSVEYGQKNKKKTKYLFQVQLKPLSG